MSTEQSIIYDEMKDATGFVISYRPQTNGSVVMEALQAGAANISATFSASLVDEAHILYMEATELLRSRAKLGESGAQMRPLVEKLFGLFCGEKISEATPVPYPPQKEFVPNPGKTIDIDVDGVLYQRLPVKTRLITTADKDILPIVEEYVSSHLKDGDIIFISEKALCITQNRVIDMSDIHPGKLAHFLARNVGNQYGTEEFHGFGHGTSMAMQALIDEAGYPRALFAALAAAVSRPFGIRGAFYYLCGKQAKSIDCPMSFLILEYAHSVKLAPYDPDGVAKRIKNKLGREVVILDANYRGAFSLGRSSRAVPESFIQKLFRDNPMGQSDEMTPFCIVRKKV